MKNLTALVSCFARAYHTKQNTSWIFYDPAAPLLLGKDYHAIAQHLITGRSFFLPGFEGSDKQALEKILNETLAPAVLLRSAFCKRAFETEKTLGCRQIVQFAAGYDSFFVTNQETKASSCLNWIEPKYWPINDAVPKPQGWKYAKITIL